MATRQFSVSVINLASSISGHRRNSAIVQESQTPIETRKHAMSDENLRTMVNFQWNKSVDYVARTSDAIN